MLHGNFIGQFADRISTGQAQLMADVQEVGKVMPAFDATAIFEVVIVPCFKARFTRHAGFYDILSSSIKYLFFTPISSAVLLTESTLVKPSL